MNDITINDISRSFGEITVFRHFSAVLKKGGIYRLDAPSGAGKTTLLRMLMRLEMPDSGSISGLPPHISALFQEDRLIESISVRKNIEIVLKTQGDGSFVAADRMSGMEEPFSGIEAELAAIGLAGCADMKAGALSGGMKRRAAIVRAMLHPSELVLLDEPFSGLDEDAREMTGAYIAGRLGGRTCVIAGHIPDARTDAISERIPFPSPDAAHILFIPFSLKAL